MHNDYNLSRINPLDEVYQQNISVGSKNMQTMPFRFLFDKHFPFPDKEAVHPTRSNTVIKGHKKFTFV